MDEITPDALWLPLYWLTVLADRGSFTRAAEQLGVSKAAMSQKIKALERQAGVPLVSRTTRSVRLTAQGEKLVAELREPFSHISQSFAAVRDASGPLRGRIRVTAPVAFARQQLVPHVTGFLRAHPQVRVQLEVSDRLVSLVSEGYDLAIRHSDTLPDSHIALPLCTTEPLLVASPDYLRHCGQPATPASLAAHHCLYYPRGSAPPDWHFTRDGDRPVSVRVSGPFATNNSESIRDAALAGLGIALLPDFSARGALESGALCRLLPDWQVRGAFARQISLLRPWAPQVPRAVTAFSQWLRAAFAAPSG
ncbi:LysR family transcriptional regulator [Pantoea sp. 1.19]|uniref:LysR family transcriptional regulator n=1 Tax=Pantoea sp. 1.19 TaxID=1925589 RepID=UPI000948DBBB|nr:LysR family transcriptional regulator [Pantoea sp. 1.19]